MLAAQDDACRDELEITWASPQARDVCLHSDRRDEPLHCWRRALTGRYSLLIDTASDIHFYLKAWHSQDLLAAMDFEVVQDQKTYRRKRRNPWSFF